LRVDEYSHVRVVSELSNGELHMDSRYVKTSGGCSAPPNRDSPELIGKTIFKLPGPPKMGAPTTADLTVIHPNDTGFELNNVTVMYIPSYFVRTIEVSYAGRKIFDADLDFSISENPTWRFNFVPHAPGELRAEVADSKERHYTGALADRAMTMSRLRCTADALRYLRAAGLLGPCRDRARRTRSASRPAYTPLVVEPLITAGRSEFDLGPALARAKRENKRLYVYLGASDCPYCRRYENFLAQERRRTGAALQALDRRRPAQHAVDDCEPALHPRRRQSLNYTDFQRAIGDQRTRMLVYPSVWLFDPQMKPLMQMPAGTGTFETVEEQLEILNLVQ
jgi:hypothetical protein